MKYSLRLLVPLVLLLSLSGCYTARGATTVEPGGKGTQTLIVGFAEQMNLLSPDEAANLKEEAREAGAEVRDWSEEGYTGFEATWRFEQPEQLSGLLSGRAATLYSLDLSVDERDGNRIYTFRNMVDPGALSSGSTLDPSLGLPGLDMPGLDMPGLDMPGVMQPDLRYRLTLPGKITSFRPDSGRKVGENTVEWTLAAGDIVELAAISEEPLPQTWLIPVVAGSLALLAVGAGLVVFLGRRKLRAAPAMAAEQEPVAAALPAAPPARTSPSAPDYAPARTGPLTGGAKTAPVASASPPAPRAYEQPGADYGKGTPTIPLSSLLGTPLAPGETAPASKTGRLCRHCDRANPAGALSCRFCGRDLDPGSDLANEGS